MDSKVLSEQNARSLEKWKAQTTQNSQKKIVLEMTFNLNLSEEQSCNELLEKQTSGILLDNETERKLEDNILDLSSQVKQNNEKIEAMTVEVTTSYIKVFIVNVIVRSL